MLLMMNWTLIIKAGDYQFKLLLKICIPSTDSTKCHNIMISIVFFSEKEHYYANLVLPLIMNHITVIVSLTIIPYDFFTLLYSAILYVYNVLCL